MLLFNEKAPYLVTLFVAAASWTAVHTAERLASTPFLEYQLSEARLDSGIQAVELRLRNITTSSRFSCFMLTVVPRRRDNLTLGDPKAQRHQLHGTVFASLTVTRAKPSEWEIRAENLAPGADIALFIPTTQTGRPAVLVGPCSIEASSSNSSKNDADKQDRAKPPGGTLPVLVEGGLSTFFVEYEIPILWGLLVGWLLTMLLGWLATWLALRPKRAPAGKGGKPDQLEDGYETPQSID